MFARSLGSVLALGLLSSSLAGCAASEAPPSDDRRGAVESAVFAPARVRFEKLFTCDDGAAYVDVNAEERRYLQLVVKDPAILGYLQSTGAASLSFGATEATFRGFTGVTFFEEFGPKLRTGNPYSGPGVFAPGEFRHFIAEYNDFTQVTPLVNIYRDGDGLRASWGSIRQLDCARSVFVPAREGVPDRTECVAYHSRYEERANWFFRKCTY